MVLWAVLLLVMSSNKKEMKARKQTKAKGCLLYTSDEYVLAPFYVYISKSKNGWQYLDSLGGAAYTSAKEEYVEHPFLVMQTAMHQAEANSRNEVYYE